MLQYNHDNISIKNPCQQIHVSQKYQNHITNIDNIHCYKKTKKQIQIVKPYLLIVVDGDGYLAFDPPTFDPHSQLLTLKCRKKQPQP